MEKDEPTIQSIKLIFIKREKQLWKNLETNNEFEEIKKQERPENIQEQRDCIEIVAVEKEPIQRQLINALIMEG